MNIRHGIHSDLAAINDLYNHYVVNTPITFDVEPITMSQRSDWFEGFQAGGQHQLLVAVDGEQFLGAAWSTPFRKKEAYRSTAECTVYCSSTGRGVGSALYTRLFEILAANGVHRAVAGITQPNEASVALHRRFSFEPVGVFSEVGRKFGQYWDVAWFEKEIGSAG